MNEAKIQSLLDKLVASGKVPNAVMSIRTDDNRVLFEGVAGYAWPDVPMTLDIPYCIASISKMYTAAVIMQLHEAGQLDLDAPLTSVLPETLIDRIHVYKGTDYSRALKIHQLVDQTSGLPDYFESKPKGGRSVFDDLKAGRDRALDLPTVLDMSRASKPNNRPGDKAFYSDTNYQLLGAVIESVTGRSTAENFQSRIFAPLGLVKTFAYSDLPQRPEDKPAPFFYGSQAVDIPAFMSFCLPDGGIVSTAAESSKFVQAFFGGRLFSKASLELMTRRWNRIFFPLQYGYGVMLFQWPRIFSPFRPVPALVGHSGASGSFSFRVPQHGLILTGNVNQTSTPSLPFRLMLPALNLLN